MGDVVAVADSIGEPVGLAGWSRGGTIAFGAAATSPAVSAVAVYGPGVFDVTNEVNPAASAEKARAVAQAVTDGRSAEAAGAMIDEVATNHASRRPPARPDRDP